MRIGTTFNKADYPDLFSFWVARIKYVYDDAISKGKTKADAVQAMNSQANALLLGLELLNNTTEAEALKKAMIALKDIGAVTNDVAATAADFSFTGAKSGILLEMFNGYPDKYPVLQLTSDQQLKWWNWKSMYPWLSYDGILWAPNDVGKFPTGFYFTPLYNIELARFLIGFNEARAGVTDPRFTASQVNAGRAKMMLGNEVVYIKNGVCYDPGSAGNFVRLKSGAGTDNYYTGTAVTSVVNSSYLTDLSGGYWAWKWIDGYEMLWRGVQFYIDNFLKVPYNVKELVAFGQSYEYQFKKAWQKNDDAKRGYLSVINFLERPVGTQTFWDKFVNYIPIIWATAASIVTAGLGSPLLIAAVGALGTAMVKAGNAKAAADAQKIYNDQMLKDTGVDKEKIEEVKNDIVEKNSNSWLWIAAAIAAVFLYKRKKKKR